MATFCATNCTVIEVIALSLFLERASDSSQGLSQNTTQYFWTGSGDDELFTFILNVVRLNSEPRREQQASAFTRRTLLNVLLLQVVECIAADVSVCRQP